MAKLPLPPTRLPELRAEDLMSLRRGTRLWRVYSAGGLHGAQWNSFRRFGPVASGRFDHHIPPPHEDENAAILYAALDVKGAIVETFQTGRVVDRFRNDPWLVSIAVSDALTMLDMTGSWPTRAGASQTIAAGRRDVARGWSVAVHDQYGHVHGLAYRSSMAGGSLNVALYERAIDAISSTPVIHLPLAHPGLDLPLARLADELGYDLR